LNRPSGGGSRPLVSTPSAGGEGKRGNPSGTDFRIRPKAVSSVVLWLLFASLPGRAQTVRMPDPLSHSHSAVSTGRDSAITLSHRYLIPASVSVFVDSIRLDSARDYRVLPVEGRILFSRPPDSGRAVLVIYRSLPLTMDPVSRRWTESDSISRKSAPAGSRAESRAAVPLPGEDDFSEDLQKSGSIFRGVSLGTDQGMRLQSGLRLQVSGRIAPNVDVVASLTDQNTPIQPEGNTQTLQEIDKVFVTLKAPRLRATLGDFMFDAPGSEFANYSRKLQGAMGTADAGFGSVTVFGAASKGDFTTNHFNGQEGNQGPYQLTGSQGEREIIVLAGTEKVWIDGEPMTRGEDNDYTIEYGTGQVTFTRRRMITSESRITVDFEFSALKFQKAIYGAVGEGRFWKDRVKFRTSLISESDDKDNPLDVPLTDATRVLLRNAGDNPDSAIAPGANPVGAGKGTYIRTDSLGQIIYQYRGNDRGDYTVHFSFVGQGRGDYSFQGYDIYRYEGPGRGAYLPVIYLPLATSHQVADVQTSLDLARGFSVDGEVGISRFDQNTYSSRDDGDNAGRAAKGRVRMEKRPVRLFRKSIGEFGFSAQAKNVDDAFRPLGRTTEVEHGRKWGTPEGTAWGENLSEMQGSYSPFKSLTLDGEYGSFKKGLLRSERAQFSTALAGPRTPAFQYRAELIRTRSGPGLRGDWLRQDGSLEGRWKGLRPSLSYNGEHRKNQSPDSAATGFRFDEWTGKLGYERKALRLEMQEALRDDRVYARNRLEKFSIARTDRIQMDLRTGSAMTAGLLFTHRVRDYSDPKTADQKTDLAEAKLSVTPWNRFIDLGLNYRFSSTQVSEMARDTIRIGAGLGNYRYDAALGEYVPDPDGDVLFRTIQTGRFLPVNDLESEIDARLDASRIWRKAGGLKGVLGGIQGRSLFRIERRDRERAFGSVNAKAFRPRWGTDSTTVMGLFAFTQDVEYNSPGGGFNLRARFRNDDSENRQLVQEGLLRRIRSRNLRAKVNPSRPFGILLEVESQRETKRYFDRLRSDRDVRLQTAALELSVRPRQDVELALKTKARSAVDAEPVPATRATSVFFLPRITISLKTRGQLRAELETGNVNAEPAGRTLPYEMLAGDQPGRTVRVNALLSYRFTGHVTATLSYRARREPWRKKTFHSGEVEMRAFF
jgi:hypothetical protein